MLPVVHAQLLHRACRQSCCCCSSAAAAAAAVSSSLQLPGTARLAQVLSGSILQHARGLAAQAARAMEQPAFQQQPEAADAPCAAAPPAVAAPPAPEVPHAATTTAPAAVQQQPHQPPSPTGVKKTFYKRKLPCPPATEFSSTDGRLLFAEALQQGTMSGFFKLIEQYSTQDEPAFCGLASIAMVLNALSIDPRRPWKGSWRWFHEELLDCCLPLNKVAQEGVVLTQAACLAKCNGANVALHRSGTFSLEEFRRAVVETCTSGEEHLVVSYTRKAFGQTGDGHFSPIGGYHGGRDLVLILDTARFKYPPHWVPLPMLYDAMGAVDPTTGQPRGYLRLSANTRPDSVLFTLDIRPDGSWQQAEAFIQSTAPQLVQAEAAAGRASPDALLQQLVALAPLDSVPSFIAMRFAASSCARDRCVPHTVRQQVLRELRATPLHQAIQPLLAQHLEQQQQPQQQGQLVQQLQEHSFLSEKLTVLLLLQEPLAWGAADLWADPQQHEAWKHLLDASAVSILDGEVGYLRQQLHHIEDVLQVTGAGSSSGGSGGSGGSSGGCGSCLGDSQEAADAVGVRTAGPAVVAAAAAAAAAATAGPAAALAEVPTAAAPVTGTAAGAAAAEGWPCSSCAFHQDCSLKGCINVHGEVEVQQGPAVSAAAARQHETLDTRHLITLDGHGCCRH